METNQVLQNIKARRSVRAYTAQQIPDQALEQILQAALYAPSGMNMQTWHFTVVQNPEKLSALNDCVKSALDKNKISVVKRGNSAYCCYYHAPTLIIVSNEATKWWAGMDCACALQNMFLAATSLGLGSCWINQVGSTCQDEAVRACLTGLGVPQNHMVYGCVALGYANQEIPLKPKAIKEGLVTIVK